MAIQIVDLPTRILAQIATRSVLGIGSFLRVFIVVHNTSPDQRRSNIVTYQWEHTKGHVNIVLPVPKRVSLKGPFIG